MVDSNTGKDWFHIFAQEKGFPPAKIEQFDAFIRNRGGKIKYSEIRSAFRDGIAETTLPAKTNHVAHSDVAMQKVDDSHRPVAQARAAAPRPQIARPTPDGKEAWIEQINSTLRGDVDMVFSLLPEEARSDKDVALAAIRRTPIALSRVTDALTSNYDFMLLMVGQAGSRLRYASDLLQANRDVVLAAVQQDGDSLQYASEALQADYEIVLAAMKNFEAYGDNFEAYPLRHAARSVKTDYQILELAMKECPGILRSGWFPKEIKADRKFMLAHISKNGSYLQFASDELKADCDLVCIAVKQDPFALRFAAESLKDDFDVVLTAMRVNKDAIKYATARLRANRTELEGMADAKMMLTLHASKPEDDKSFLNVAATNMMGNEVANLLLSLTCTVVELKDQIANALKTNSSSIECLLPNGERLVEFEDDSLLASVFPSN